MKFLTNVYKNNDTDTVQRNASKEFEASKALYPTSWSEEMNLVSQLKSLYCFLMLSTHVINQQSTVLYDIGVESTLPSFTNNT